MQCYVGQGLGRLGQRPLSRVPSKQLFDMDTATLTLISAVMHRANIPKRKAKPALRDALASDIQIGTCRGPSQRAPQASAAQSSEVLALSSLEPYVNNPADYSQSISIRRGSGIVSPRNRSQPGRGTDETSSVPISASSRPLSNCRSSWLQHSKICFSRQ